MDNSIMGIGVAAGTQFRWRIRFSHNSTRLDRETEIVIVK
jgi:hypothetical protein